MVIEINAGVINQRPEGEPQLGRLDRLLQALAFPIIWLLSKIFPSMNSPKPVEAPKYEVNAEVRKPEIEVVDDIGAYVRENCKVDEIVVDGVPVHSVLGRDATRLDMYIEGTPVKSLGATNELRRTHLLREREFQTLRDHLESQGLPFGNDPECNKAMSRVKSSHPVLRGFVRYLNDKLDKERAKVFAAPISSLLSQNTGMMIQKEIDLVIKEQFGAMLLAGEGAIPVTQYHLSFPKEGDVIAELHVVVLGQSYKMAFADGSYVDLPNPIEGSGRLTFEIEASGRTTIKRQIVVNTVNKEEKLLPLKKHVDDNKKPELPPHPRAVKGSNAPRQLPASKKKKVIKPVDKSPVDQVVDRLLPRQKIERPHQRKAVVQHRTNGQHIIA